MKILADLEANISKKLILEKYNISEGTLKNIKKKG
jgi:hypothetical protein